MNLMVGSRKQHGCHAFAIPGDKITCTDLKSSLFQDAGIASFEHLTLTSELCCGIVFRTLKYRRRK